MGNGKKKKRPRYEEVLETAKENLRLRTLRDTALAQQIESALSSVQEQEDAPDPKGIQKYIFKREGASWRIVYDEKPVFVKDSLGMHYIQMLIQNSHRAIPATRLLSIQTREDPVTVGHARDVLVDPKTLRDIAKSREVLEREIDLPDTDPERLMEIKEELEKFARYEKSSKAVRGRARYFKDEPERARQSVQKSIKRALTAIASAHAEAGNHLRVSLTLGHSPVYAPLIRLPWVTH